MIDAAQRGGARRAVELPEGEALTPERARTVLAGMIEAAASGAIDSGTARTVGYLLQVESRIYDLDGEMPGASVSDRIAAIREMSRMLGFNAPPGSGIDPPMLRMTLWAKRGPLPGEKAPMSASSGLSSSDPLRSPSGGV